MTIGSILLGLALLVVVVLFVARPLLTFQPESKSAVNRRRKLEEQKETLLAEIHSLDFDHDTGKIPDGVYELQRAHLMSEAAAILKTLDEMSVESDDDLQRQIEAAIARRRHKTVQASNGQGSYCHNCGKHLDPGDKFCTHCGQAVRAVQPIV